MMSKKSAKNEPWKAEEAAAALTRAGVSTISPEAPRILADFMSEVALWSERMHLVGKGRIRKSLKLLLFDSLLLLRTAEEAGLFGGSKADEPETAEDPGDSGRSGEAQHACHVADIGSGAGFPGIVWKIVRPDLDMTLFERKEKPRLFLERIVRRLSLEGVRVAGEAAGEHGDAGAFRVVISKAAGGFALLLPLADALLAPGGAYVTIKGVAWRSELDGAPAGTLRLESAVDLSGERGTVLIFNRV